MSILASAVAAANRLPWSDEGWFSSPSHNLAKQGFLGTTVIETAGTGLTRIEQHTYWVMPLYLLAQALWYRVFPASVFSTRALTILCIPFALWGFHVFLSSFWPRSGMPALGVCLLALSFVFIDNAGFARPDLLCCTLGIWGLAAYLVLRDRSLIRALFLANALIAASALTHPNGLLHFFGLLTLILWYDRHRISVRAVAASLAPYILLGGAWLLYAYQDFPAFLDQMRANGVNNERWASTLNPFLLVWNEIRDRYLVAFGFQTRGIALAKAFALCMYLAAVAGCLIDPRLRKLPAARLLLMLLAVYFSAMSVFNQKLTYYLVHILPFYIALLAVWSVHLWSVYPRARRFVACALLILVSVETGGVLLKAQERSYVSAQRKVVRYVLSNTLPSDRIVSSAALIFEMRFDPRLCDDSYLGTRSGREPDAIVIDRIYRSLYASWGEARPADMRKINGRLAAYRLTYRDGDYAVYFRPGK